MSIFFAVIMVVLITMIAFIINVGLYVKAKINLQNAVDAAAFSGAAVQARQLSNIGYLNWEMRNVYKEWLFKYYVLGNLSIKDVADPSRAAESVNFTMEQAPGNNSAIDKYNFPSVCIHFADTVDICRRYEIPGLPRFTNTALPGIDESSTHFVDEIVKKKAEDCSRRSQINFYTAALWAYGVPDPMSQAMQKIAPKIANNRVGAYPAAVELAFRIRNLENMVNTVSIDSIGFNKGVCNNPGSSQGLQCGVQISQLTSFAYPHFERTVKAFYSAFRNLGNEDDDELKGSFVLTELTPTPFEDGNNFAISNLLIPQGKREKYYLDLQLHTLNLVNFYSVFTSKDGQTSDGTVVQGECMVTKVGLPIPGYPYGFVKNQNVLTYYAVKGEANFIGLFNPFRGYTKLTAYSAAKPFGGRIGPKTFKNNAENTSIVSRSNAAVKSASHILGIGITPNGRYKPGDAIPLEPTFWIQQPDENIGGWATDSVVKFALPNMIYDTLNINMGNHTAGDKLYIINTTAPNPTAQGLKIGLYDKDMLKALKNNLDMATNGGVITPDSITEAIHNVRAPTKFDVDNYLVPVPMQVAKGLKLDSFGTISDVVDANNNYTMRIYAPLYNPEAIFLYQNAGQLEQEINDYINKQDQAVETYETAMWSVAQRMRDQNTNVNSLYYKSSDIISDDRGQGAPAKNATCASMAGAYKAYFNGGSSGDNCPKSFLSSLRDRWTGISGDAKVVEYHRSTFRMPTNGLTGVNLLTAYAPGVMTGSDNEAFVVNPFLPEAQESGRRNFYSTKFIHLNLLLVVTLHT